MPKQCDSKPLGASDIRGPEAPFSTSCETKLEQLVIEELETEIATMDAEQASELRAIATAYEENIPRLERAKRGRRSMLILCALLIIGVIVSGYSAWSSSAEDPFYGLIWWQFCGLMALMLIIAIGGFRIMVNRIQGLSEVPVRLARKLQDIRRQYDPPTT